MKRNKATDLTFLFTEEFLKRSEKNNGFFLIGCHGKGQSFASLKAGNDERRDRK